MFKKTRERVSYWYNYKMLQLSVLYSKAKREALKLTFAVVVAEALMVGGFYFSIKYGLYEFFQPKTITIIAQAKPIQENPETIQKPENMDREQLMDFIWNKESTRGKNNYSKCEAIGKINGIGYGIDGSGAYRCFNSHAEEMEVLKGWIIDHEAQGMNRLQMLKHYTPSYKE